MGNIVFESRLQSVTRKNVLTLILLLGIPVFASCIIYAPAIFGSAFSYIISAFAIVGLFAIGYIKGIGSSNQIKIFKEDDYFRLEQEGEGGFLKQCNELKLINYGWIYEDFASVITNDMDEDLVSMRSEGRKLVQKTSNLMVVVQLKSNKETIFLLESISPWRSTPNQLPYFHQPNIDKESTCFYVKGLEKMIADLNLNIN